MSLPSTDRKSLIRLAASFPKGSDERKAILVGFQGDMLVASTSERSAYSGGPGQYGDATEDPGYDADREEERNRDPCESNPEYTGMSLDEVYECAPDAVDAWKDAGEDVMAGLKRLGFKVREGKDRHEDGQLGMEIFIQGPLGKAQIVINGNIEPNGQLKRGWGLYTAIIKGGDWWDFKHLKHGEVEMDGGNVRRFVKKVLDVWADGGLKRTRKASSDRQALIRLASALPKGGNERRVLLAELQKESVYRKSDKAKKLDSRNGYDLWEDRNKWVITDRRGRVYLEPFGLRRDADKAWGMLK